MKHLIVIGVLACLAGCVSAPPGQYGYQPGYAQSGDPAEWRVVSVTPVPRGTAERNGAVAQYAPAPVYAPGPVYQPAPVYVEPGYYVPPVSLSLGLVFGRHWGGGRHHRHGYGRRHR